jgi:hypothetical protein
MIMRKLFIAIITAVCLFSCSSNKTADTENGNLRFHNGKFRIAQFTDIHWESGDPENTANRRMVTEAVENEKPDLCILTGDIVTGGDPKEGWREIVEMMESTGKPYIVVMGNHDPEFMAADSIYNLINALGKNHIGECGDPDINGYGNTALKIKGENTDIVKAAIYCFDSGNRYKEESLSYYDNIHNNQVAWYISESEKLRIHNGGKPVPSIAYFHICLPEYQMLADDTTKIYGHFGEHCSSSELNSGLFSAALEQGDLMGMFVGHDHSSDFIGLWKGVALGYGRQSGSMREDPTTPRGCRIVELTEGKRSFESWIWTPRGEEGRFYYPSGINADMEKEELFMKAQDINESDVKQGITFKYYEGYEGLKSTDAMISKGELKEQGVMDSITIENAKAEDHFGYVFDGLFKAEKKEVYIFSLISDDGAKLFIDDKCIIDNDGSHSIVPVEAYVALDKGYHKFRLHYFEDYMGQQLDLFLTTKDIRKKPLPAKLLYINK